MANKKTSEKFGRLLLSALMDDVEVTKPDLNPQLEAHHIYLPGGQVVSVMAYKFKVHLNKKIVYFYDSETDRSKKVFWQLHEVAGVVASSALAELPPIVKLQSQVDALGTRMDSFEANFAARMDAFQDDVGKIIARAVRAGMRGEKKHPRRT